MALQFFTTSVTALEVVFARDIHDTSGNIQARLTLYAGTSQYYLHDLQGILLDKDVDLAALLERNCIHPFGVQAGE